MLYITPNAGCQATLDDLLKALCPTTSTMWEIPMPMTGHYCPDVDRIHFNGNKTVVWFKNGSKVLVECSSSDSYDRQTALAYAICKWLFGIVKEDGTVDGNGFGSKMKKLVDSGFDQVKEEQEAAARKKAAKERHAAIQAAQREAAFERRARARAEELRLERRAEEILREDSLRNSKTKVINEDSPTAQEFFANTPSKETTRTSGLVQIDPKDAWKLYRRPNKPFSQFTDAEKREYWKAHNAKRRAQK